MQLTSMRVSSGSSGASKVTAPSRLAAVGSAKVYRRPDGASSISPAAPRIKCRPLKEPPELRELDDPTGNQNQN